MAQTKADRPFWLGGGEDREAAEACRYAPEHRWVSIAVGDMLRAEFLAELSIEPADELTICRGCYAPRCTQLAHASTRRLLARDDLPKVGEGEVTLDRCVRAMNHRERFHRFASHPAEPVSPVPAHA